MPAAGIRMPRGSSAHPSMLAPNTNSASSHHHHHHHRSRSGSRSNTPVKSRESSGRGGVRSTDTSILRGATIIREQIRQRLEEQERNRQRAAAGETVVYEQTTTTTSRHRRTNSNCKNSNSGSSHNNRIMHRRTNSRESPPSTTAAPWLDSSLYETHTHSRGSSSSSGSRNHNTTEKPWKQRTHSPSASAFPHTSSRSTATTSTGSSSGGGAVPVLPHSAFADDDEDDDEDILTLDGPGAAYLPSKLQQLGMSSSSGAPSGRPQNAIPSPPSQHQHSRSPESPGVRFRSDLVTATGNNNNNNTRPTRKTLSPQQATKQTTRATNTMRAAPPPSAVLRRTPKSSAAIARNPLAARDPGYAHALEAGLLWQSLVGEQIRFPKTWFPAGARTPPLGNVVADWKYVDQAQVRNDAALKRLVFDRAAPGRLLLHIVVLDDASRQPVRDLAIGCFHPNARGVRASAQPVRTQEGIRTLWMAVRKRSNLVCPIDKPLKRRGDWDSTQSPLDNNKKVSNANVRAVYGDQPPLETIFVPAAELHGRLQQDALDASPTLIFLRDFVLG